MNDIELADVEVIRCLGVARICAMEELSTVIPAAATEVDAALRRARIKPHDDLVALYRIVDNKFSLHIGRPANEEPPEELEVFELPGGPVARTLHVGAYNQLGYVTERIFSWAREHHRKPGLSWETYHHLADPAAPTTTVTVALRA
jgi:effector-binding domain-containing protein